MISFAHDGECGFCGTWSTITAAKSFDVGLIDPARIAKLGATHIARYSTGGTAALLLGDTLTGGSSTSTCKLIYKITENGTAGSSDSGWLFVNKVSGPFQAETLTGTSTGTVVIYQDLVPLLTSGHAKAALITVEVAAIRFTTSGHLAGTLAASAVGHVMDSGQSYVVRGWNNIKNFSAINNVNANSAVLHYSLYY